MTVKEMNDLGFYRQNNKIHPEKWQHFQYTTCVLIITYLQGININHLLTKMYEAGMENGRDYGKREKAQEIRKVLHIKE